MSDSELAEDVAVHARRGRRRDRMVYWSLIGSLGVLTLGTRIVLGSLSVSISVAALGFLLLLPLIRSENEFELRSDASPAEVRDDFFGLAHPFTIYARTVGEIIESDDTGGTIEMTGPLGVLSTRIRYETEERDDGDLRVRVFQGGTEWSQLNVSIYPDGDTGSRVLVTHSVQATSVSHLLKSWAHQPRLFDAFEAHGYTVMRAEGSNRLRRPF